MLPLVGLFTHALCPTVLHTPFTTTVTVTGGFTQDITLPHLCRIHGLRSDTTGLPPSILVVVCGYMPDTRFPAGSRDAFTLRADTFYTHYRYRLPRTFPPHTWLFTMVGPDCNTILPFAPPTYAGCTFVTRTPPFDYSSHGYGLDAGYGSYATMQHYYPSPRLVPIYPHLPHYVALLYARRVDTRI